VKQFIASDSKLRDDLCWLDIFKQGARITVSQQTLEAVIGRAILDEEFRSALFADPGAALGEYELSKGERTALKSVDAESLDSCAHNVRRRIALGFSTVKTQNSPPG
jgi:hypothetical protein